MLEVVDLVATPDPGYRFATWNHSTTIGIADINDASTVMAPLYWMGCFITANFERMPSVPFGLTNSSTSGGSVTAPGEGTFTYEAGRVVSLVASPASGYRFVNWTGNVSSITNVSAATTTITMDRDYSITASFEEMPKYILTISSTAQGLVTDPGEGTFTYDPGTEVNLVAEAEEGYSFYMWDGDVDTVDSIYAASTTIVMEDDYEITAKFGRSCFIATAAYGTPVAEEIQILRQFRGEHLLTNPLGQALVDIYYTVSPPMAEFITEHPSLKPIVRVGLLPAVAMSAVVVNTTPTHKATAIGLLVVVSAAVAVWIKRRRGGEVETRSIPEAEIARKLEM
jgi:hypothetical protein